MIITLDLRDQKIMCTNHALLAMSIALAENPQIPFTHVTFAPSQHDYLLKEYFPNGIPQPDLMLETFSGYKVVVE